MQTMLLTPIPDEVMFEERNIAFRAILLYEHAEGAELAKAILGRVCTRLPDAATAEIKPWCFDRLRDPLAAQLAHSHATDAEVVLVVARGVEPLPAEVKEALENWALPNVAAGLGCVVLLTDVRDGEKSKSPVHRHLKSFCHRTGCDFFSRGLKTEWEQARCVSEARIESDLADQEFMAMSGPTRRWGIND